MGIGGTISRRLASYPASLRNPPITPQGRIGRTHYVLTLILALIAANLLDQALMPNLAGINPLLDPISAAYLWISFCLHARRAHDAGSSATFALVMMAAAAAAFAGIYVLEELPTTNEARLVTTIATCVCASVCAIQFLQLLFSGPSPDASRWGADPRLAPAVFAPKPDEAQAD